MLHIEDKIITMSASFTCGFLLCSLVPWQHYQPTNGVEGARVDKDKRPELSMGSYEILSPQKVKFIQTSLHVVWNFVAFYVKISAGMTITFPESLSPFHWDVEFLFSIETDNE